MLVTAKLSLQPHACHDHDDDDDDGDDDDDDDINLLY